MEGKPQPYVTSCKGSIGHLLGGAGAVESAFAALSIRNGPLLTCLHVLVLYLFSYRQPVGEK